MELLVGVVPAPLKAVLVHFHLHFHFIETCRKPSRLVQGAEPGCRRVVVEQAPKTAVSEYDLLLTGFRLAGILRNGQAAEMPLSEKSHGELSPSPAANCLFANGQDSHFTQVLSSPFSSLQSLSYESIWEATCNFELDSVGIYPMVTREQLTKSPDSGCVYGSCEMQLGIGSPKCTKFPEMWKF